MKIAYLGTSAAEGFPAVYCNCQYCTQARKEGLRHFRTRSQVVIDDVLAIDYPPESYVHSLSFGVDLSALTVVLFTHSHMDHCYVQDFILRGYKYTNTLTAPELDLYGNAEVAAVYAEGTRRELKDEVAKHIHMHPVHAYQEFFAQGYRVLTMPAVHDPKEEALLFYVEKDGVGYLHLHDTAVFDDEVYTFLKAHSAKANVVSFDCTFAMNTSCEHRRHMGVYDNMEVKKKLIAYGICGNETKYVCTHFAHHQNPTRKNLQKMEQEFGVIAAYDGLIVEV